VLVCCWKFSSVIKLIQSLCLDQSVLITLSSSCHYQWQIFKNLNILFFQRHTFDRCSLTKLRLWRVCSLDAILCRSSVRLCRNSSNDWAVQEFTAVSPLVLDGCVTSASDSELAISELTGVNGNPSVDAVLLFSSQFTGDKSWDNGISRLILAAAELWLDRRQGRFGVTLEVPYRLQRLTCWLRLWFLYKFHTIAE